MYRFPFLRERQEGEIGALRKECEEVCRERDTLRSDLRTVRDSHERLLSSHHHLSLLVNKLEEEKAKLQDYVCKYEAELVKNESKVHALAAALAELEEHVHAIEIQNERLEALIKKMNDNITDRDFLQKEFAIILQTKRPRKTGDSPL